MKTTASSPPARRRSAARDDHVELHLLQDSALLLVSGARAAGLCYRAGSTPTVSLTGQGKAIDEMVWYAHEHSIPVVELHSLSAAEWQFFHIGEEIPPETYRAVASALALVHKSANAPELVRFVRPLSRRPRFLGEKAAALVEEFGSILDLPMLYVQCGNGVWSQRQEFEDAVMAMRGRLVLETGQPLAPVPSRPSPHVGEHQYRLIFKDTVVDEGELQLPADSPEKIYPLVARVRHVIAQHGWEMLTCEQVEALLARHRKEHPGLHKQLFPTHLTTLSLRTILRNLLREGLSIRELTLILEIILEHLPFTQDADLLTEMVRACFARELCQKVEDPQGNLPVIVLDVEVENTLLSALQEVGGVRWLDASPDLALRFMRAVGEALKAAAHLNVRCALLVSPILRRFLALLLHTVYEDVPVLAYNEITVLTDVRAVSQVQFNHTPL